MFLSGGLELAIASLAVQILLGLSHSVGEFRKDRWLEGCSQLLMAGIRCNQLNNQLQILELQHKPAGVKKGIRPPLVSFPRIDPSNEQGLPPLLHATKMGDEQTVKALITDGADVFVRDSERNTGLHYALLSRNHALVRLYLDAGIKPTDRGILSPLGLYGAHTCELCSGGPAWLLAIIIDDKTSLELLIEYGLPITKRDCFLNGDPYAEDLTPIMCCIALGRLELLQFLIQKDALFQNVSPRYDLKLWRVMASNADHFGSYMEKYTDMKEKIRCLDWLYESGHFKITRDLKEEYEDLLLMCSPDFLEWLLEKQAITANKLPYGRNAPLRFCYTDPKKLRILINHGCDLNRLIEDGRSALHLLSSLSEYNECTEERLEALKVLLEAGANVNLLDKYHDTALLRAGNRDVRGLLIRYGAKE